MLTRSRTYSGTNQTSEPGAFISDQGEWRFDEEWEMKAPDWIDNDGGKGSDTANAQFDDFFPLHSTCADILQRFTQYQSRFCLSNLPKSVREFFDACIACQKFSKKNHGRLWTCEQSDTRPPDYDRYGGVEWSHLYLGARRFWTDPWDCTPGQEYLCADPISELQIGQLVTQYLTRPKSSSQNIFSLSTKQLPLQDSAPSKIPLMRCDKKILQLIASHLPLQSAINLHASSHRLSSLISAKESDFWRWHTLRLHGSWFWELCDHQDSSTETSSYTNWEELLQVLNLSRREIVKGAKRYWLESPANEYIDAASNDEHISDKNTPSLPLGLRNRQRIWMCLESLDIDGMSEKP